jgi:hypothetical protein
VSTWQPNWLCDDAQLSAANVNSVVALAVRLEFSRNSAGAATNAKIVPQRLAAAVRNDVCIWHIRRPEYED